MSRSAGCQSSHMRALLSPFSSISARPTRSFGSLSSGFTAIISYLEICNVIRRSSLLLTRITCSDENVKLEGFSSVPEGRKLQRLFSAPIAMVAEANWEWLVQAALRERVGVGSLGQPVHGIAGNVPSSLANNLHIDEILLIRYQTGKEND